MSWQRIDENTYIDDTLVTCAEYQLFIDEMREQGKYYQPDHWTSYQFPKGKAREPILGARYNDAVAFCDWLTTRETNKWRYRLPMQNEVGDYPVKPYFQTPIVYWSSDENNEQAFSWIGAEPIDPNMSNSRLAPTLARSSTIAAFLDPIPVSARELALEIGNEIAPILNRSMDHPRAIAINNVLVYAENLVSIIASLYESRGDHKIALAILNRALKTVRPIDIENDFDLALNLNLNISIGLATDLFNYFFTLQERIAGRSPAFEGIRLVKERK